MTKDVYVQYVCTPMFVSHFHSLVWVHVFILFQLIIFFLGLFLFRQQQSLQMPCRTNAKQSGT